MVGKARCQDTHKESDLPALHSFHLDNDVLGLVIRQGYAAADLIIADGKKGLAAGFWVVTGAGFQLHVSIVLNLPGELQKLLQSGVGMEEAKDCLKRMKNLMSEATAILTQHLEWSHSESTFFFRVTQMKTTPCVLTGLPEFLACASLLTIMSLVFLQGSDIVEIKYSVCER